MESLAALFLSSKRNNIFVLKKCLTPNEALNKIKLFCSYQERCHSEVKTKLFDFGLVVKDVDEILSKLIEENYLNEERFAILYFRR